MKTKNIFLIFVIFILFGGCSKLQKELPEPTSPTVIHAKGWEIVSSENFHGKYLHKKEWQLTDCISCHGSDFSGGTSKVSCYTCHSSYPHRAGFLQKNSPYYHGLYLKSESWVTTSCQGCHGTDLSGGNNGVKCATCHDSYPHKAGWKVAAQTTFHGKYLKDAQWDMKLCTGCHGSGYDGGSVTNVSCMTSQCHVDASGRKKSPEACNTCHGSFSTKADSIFAWAPPRSVDGETATTFKGVGAHQKHLATGTFGKAVKCSECHSVPNQTFVNGHLDSNLPAEVIMNDTLARLITANGLLVPNPTYQTTNATCSNTYCHGNWRLRRATSTAQFGYADSVMVGANRSVVWTGGTSEAACGTCHANPPTGHVAATLSTCGNCHTGIVNSSGAIIDKAKHINGKIMLFGTEKNMN
ncbi:MAG: CxxxxCH/CxxCH domain-containing protein [Bacteroidota bacterium]|nr:CxxxxCH/CxxCH domain-containing protein [Bacteroidota bacterium]